MMRLKYLIILVMALLASSPALAAQLVTRIVLDNPTRVEDREIRRIFKPKSGEPYDRATVRRSVELLSLLTGVENVEVSSASEADGVALKISLKPETLIRSIIIEGVKHFEKAELEASLLSRPDAPVFMPKLQEDMSTILKGYRDDGYADADGFVQVEKLKDGLWSNVHFVVNEGSPQAIDAFGEVGDMSKVGAQDFLKALGLNKGSVASSLKLREGVKKALAYCYAKDYPEARIIDAKFRQAEGKTLLDVPLNLGRRTKIALEGLTEAEKLHFNPLVAQEYGTRIDADNLSRFVTLIREEMISLGYLNAAVTPTLTEDKESRRLNLKVVRGSRIIVKKVRYEGNTLVTAKQLKETTGIGKRLLIDDPYSQELIESELSRIRQLYVAKGVFDTNVEVKELTVDEDSYATIVIAIQEGRQNHFGQITYKTDGCFNEVHAQKIAGLQAGIPADPGKVEAARVKLIEELSRLGFDRGSVDYKTSLRKEEGLVDVSFNVVGQMPHRFGTILIVGNARTRSHVILRELTFKTGDPWSQQEIINSRQNIFHLGYFQQVEFRALARAVDDEALDLVITVRELDAGKLDYGIGYGTEEGIKTFVEFGHSNIGGEGRSASVRIEFTGPNQAYTLNYKEPRIFTTPLDLNLTALRQHQELTSYTLDSTSFQTALEYDYSKRLKFTLSHTLEDDHLSEIQDSTFLGQKTFLASTLSPLAVLDTRDDLFNPRKGFLSSMQYEWASRSIGSDLEYSKVTGATSGYFSAGKATLALAARVGAAEYYGRDELLPLNKRFFLGGRSTVRGFGTDAIGPKAADGTPLGGDLMLNLKAELRFSVYKDFGLAAFWDAGQVWFRKQTDPKISDLRQAAGPGLRYNTPVGPLALDIGYKLDREPGESGYEWHFTIGNVF